MGHVGHRTSPHEEHNIGHVGYYMWDMYDLGLHHMKNIIFFLFLKGTMLGNSNSGAPQTVLSSCLRTSPHEEHIGHVGYHMW